MRRAILIPAAAAFCLLAAGVRERDASKTQGRLVKGGQPFVPFTLDQLIQILFVPILPSAQPAGRLLRCGGRSGHRNLPLGRQGHEGDARGQVPRGDRTDEEEKGPVRRKVRLREIALLVFDIDSKTSEIVIDLDKPPAQSAEAAVAAPAARSRRRD